MKPTWETAGVKLYLADCESVLPFVSADAVITDPPYGVRFVCGSPDGRIQGGQIVRHREPIIGDDREFDPAPFLRFPVVVLFGANNFSSRLPDSRGWVFWNKRPGLLPNDFGDGEFIWTNQDRPIRCFDYLWNGVLQAGEKGRAKCHPAQKPEALMEWLIKGYSDDGDTVLDPYMGSGTTGVSCVRTGRRFVGIEIDPAHFATAVRRIEAELNRAPLFDQAPKVTQRELIP